MMGGMKKNKDMTLHLENCRFKKPEFSFEMQQKIHKKVNEQ